MTTAIENRVEQREVTIPVEGVTLHGTLAWPIHPTAVVLFGQGNDNGQLHARDQAIAQELRAAGIATLLFDFGAECETFELRETVNVNRWANRLVGVAHWVNRQPEVMHLPIGVFGTLAGGTAALVAAVKEADLIGAVVAYEGHLQLADEILPKVTVPTLLLAGGEDDPVLDINRRALGRLNGPRQLVVVPGALPVFEEPEAQLTVARWAAQWFVRYLVFDRIWREVTCC